MNSLKITGNVTNIAQKSRKRTRNPTKHKIQQKKLEVQSGEEYITHSGKIMQKKIFSPQSTCQCRRNCSERVNILRQREIFENFYKFENWTQKTLFLRTLVRKSDVKKNSSPIIKLKNKHFVHSYYLHDSFEKQQQVCSGFLLKCLQICKSTLHSAINSAVTNEVAKDFRGSLSHNKTKDSDILFVKEFIDKFPKYESHYKLSSTNIKYLSPYWNIRRMYLEYEIKF